MSKSIGGPTPVHTINLQPSLPNIRPNTGIPTGGPPQGVAFTPPNSKGGNIVQGVVNFLKDENNRNTIISGLKHLISFRWSCLGKQAFNKNDYDYWVGIANQKLNESKDEKSLVDLLIFLETGAIESDIEIGGYRSACSKELRGKYRDYLRGMQERILDKMNPILGHTMEQGVNYSGQRYSYRKFFIKNEAYIEPVSPPITDYPITAMPVNEGNDLGILDEDGGLLDIKGNLLPIDPALYTPGFVAPISEGTIPELEIIKNNGKDTWSIGGNGRTNDGVNWQIGASKDNDDDTMTLVLLGLLGLVAYKVFVK